MHNDRLRYVRSEDGLGTLSGAEMIGTNEESISYPRFVRRADGRLLFVYRNGESGSGDTLVNVYDETTDKWQRLAHLLDGRSSGESPYLHRVAVDDTGAIHVMVVWRGTGNAATNNDLGYAVSRDGGQTWARSDGRAYRLPIVHSDMELAIDTVPQGSGLLNQGGMHVDRWGRPHAVVLLYDDKNETEYVHVWHDGAEWRHDIVTDFGLRMETDVNIIDPVLARPHLVIDDRGDVWIIYRADVQPQDGLVLARHVNTGVDHVLAEFDVGQWEPSVDSAALERQGRLVMLIVPSSKFDDASRLVEDGWILDVELARLRDTELLTTP